MRKPLVALSVALIVTAVAAADTNRSTVGQFDKHWLQSDTQGNIAVGKLALQKGSGQACDVARMLITDHGKALRENRTVGKQLHVLLPKAANPLQQAII